HPGSVPSLHRSREGLMATLSVNGKPYQVNAAPDTPLLWVIREHLPLTGTKLGCRSAQGGAASVHINGTPARCCDIALSAATGKKMTTIDGLTPQGQYPLQVAWIAE